MISVQCFQKSKKSRSKCYSLRGIVILRIIYYLYRVCVRINHCCAKIKIVRWSFPSTVFFCSCWYCEWSLVHVCPFSKPFLITLSIQMGCWLAGFCGFQGVDSFHAVSSSFSGVCHIFRWYAEWNTVLCLDYFIHRFIIGSLRFGSFQNKKDVSFLTLYKLLAPGTLQ